MKTLKVRIAVAVDAQGRWYAYGTCADDDAKNMTELQGCAHYVCDDDCDYLWVEADVPLPDAPTVQGRVCDEETT